MSLPRAETDKRKKASEQAAVTGESSESQLGDRLNKQALKNAILL
ncbi:hypothetical protein QUA42_07560 [Microcoleus sp. Pol11C2]